MTSAELSGENLRKNGSPGRSVYMKIGSIKFLLLWSPWEGELPLEGRVKLSILLGSSDGTSNTITAESNHLSLIPSLSTIAFPPTIDFLLPPSV